MRVTPPSSPLVHTRIGVVGDIHTEADVLAWALDVLHAQKVERIFATGDIVDGPQHGAGVVRACKLLRDADVLTVQGNHDRWLLDNDRRDFPDATFLDEIDAETKAFLQKLPRSLEIMTPLGLMLFGHGLGIDDMAGVYPYDHGPALSDNVQLQALLHARHYQLVLSGHTHRRMVRKVDNVYFINAGAIKVTREPCCLVLDFNLRKATFYDYAADGGGTQPGPVFDL
jgi:predicted phosphodiesterase